MQFIKQEFADGVGRITLDRPDKRNALNREMLNQFCECVDRLKETKELRALVLQSAGPVFCAGMDLGQMLDRGADEDKDEQWQEDAESYHNALLALLSCRSPTIAAVSGPAIAGGVGLVLACDIVIAADSAFFALPEPQRGIVAAMVMPLLLRRTSQARAGYMALSGKRIAAVQALAIGLCDEVLPLTDFESALQAVLQGVLEGSPNALAATKQFLTSIGSGDLREALNRAIRVSGEARASSDAREGLNAFLEKRKPAWSPQEETS